MLVPEYYKHRTEAQFAALFAQRARLMHETQIATIELSRALKHPETFEPSATGPETLMAEFMTVSLPSIATRHALMAHMRDVMVNIAAHPDMCQLMFQPEDAAYQVRPFSLARPEDSIETLVGEHARRIGVHAHKLKKMMEFLDKNFHFYARNTSEADTAKFVMEHATAFPAMAAAADEVLNFVARSSKTDIRAAAMLHFEPVIRFSPGELEADLYETAQADLAHARVQIAMTKAIAAYFAEQGRADPRFFAETPEMHNLLRVAF